LARPHVSAGLDVYLERRLNEPDPYAIAAVVPLGKPVRVVTKLRRRPVSEFVTRERFDGTPFTG
jgi:hypothetical protein